MKKIYKFFIALSFLALNIPFNGYAQCPAAGVNYPPGTFTPTTSWQVLSTESWPGDYALFNVTSGITYEWSYCTIDGGFVTWDSELTLYNNADLTTYLDYSDDACSSTASKISWVATFTGVARIKITELPCLETNQINSTLVYRSIGGITPPANDNCAGAIILPVNSSCIPTTADITGASQTLAGCTGTANNDVWFQFTATSTASVISVTGSLDFDAVVEVFSGTCGSLTSMSCTDTSLEGETEAVTLSNLIIGNTYFIRVFDWYAAFPATSTFDICVYSIATCNITAPGGAVNETETCGLDQNGGCNMVTPTYQPIACGNTIFGTAWADNGSRDTDWYSFTLSGSTPVNLTASAEFPSQILLIDVSNCGALAILLDTSGAQCNPLTINTTLPAGSYAAFISHGDFYGNPCGGANNNYTLTLTYNTPASITPSGSTTICTGGNVTLTANAGQSYSWSTGATTQSINVTTGGSYGVTVTYAGGCTSAATPVTVTVSTPTTTITPSGATTFCSGGSVNLTASAGNSYSWSTGATTQSISVNSTGNYTVTVTYSGGCSSSATQSVTVNTAPTTTITPSGATTFCQGGSVTLTASAGQSYSWSTGATTQSINATGSGNYSVTVTYAGGCTSTSAPTTVTVNTAPATTITPSGPTTFCSGGTVNLTASAGTSYQWSGGGTSQSINVVSSGNYTVTVTYANGCTSSATQNINVNPNPTPSISGVTTICPGQTTTLDAGSGYTSYAWNTGGTSQTVNVQGGSYNVTVTNANGCTGSASATVNVQTVPTTSITPSGPTTFCPGGSVTLTATSGTSYSWSNGNTTQSINATNTGTYTVTVTYAGGCTGTASQSVTVSTTPTTTITPSGSTTICTGSSVTLTATAGNSYSWSNGSTTQSINVTIAGNYSVTVTYPGNCTGTSAPVTVTVNTAPTTTITPSGPTTFCQGGSVVLTASNGQSYMWSTGATAQSINVTSTGTYDVTVTYANGCTSSASQSVTVNPAPTTSINASGPTTFCQGGSVLLTATSGLTYNWSNGATTQSITVTQSGSYGVTVSYVGGCTSSATPVVVTVNPVPTTNITPSGSTTFCQGGSVNLTASTGISYSWSNGATSQSVTVMNSGTYTVTVVYNGGCSSTSVPTTVTVNPLPATPTITVSGSDLVSSSGTGNQWYFNGNIIPGANASTYTPAQNGNYTVQVTDANGCTAVSAPFNVTGVSISEHFITNGISVYPNPVSDNFVVELQGINETAGNILITNALGQFVRSENLIPANEMKWTFNVSDLKPGVYFVQLQFESKNYVTRIVVER